MSAAIMLIPAQILTDAVQKANDSLVGQGYTLAADAPSQPKTSAQLRLVYADGTTKNIGVVHLVHLKGEDWVNRSYKDIARTADEVAIKILARIVIFFNAEKKGLFINRNGSVFDYNGVSVVVDPGTGTFSINDRPVTNLGQPLSLSQFKSEGVIVFMAREGGVVELHDALDKRVGRGLFVHPDGKVYRA